jgi:predicted enzyme related to lactoylglutathione lyase
MSNKLAWFEIIGGDADKLHSFYSDLFDWKLDAENEMRYGVVSDDQSGVGGGIGPDPEGGPGYVTFYIGVDDIKASMSKVQELGGTEVMAPMTLDSGMTFALFNDPEGHMIGLIQN